MIKFVNPVRQRCRSGGIESHRKIHHGQPPFVRGNADHTRATIRDEHKSLRMASSDIHANAISGSAHASHASFSRAARVAAEKRGRDGGRPAPRRFDDGPLPRRHAIHLRSHYGPGRHTDRGDDALHPGPNKQKVERGQIQDWRAHTGRLRQGYIRLGDGVGLH